LVCVGDFEAGQEKGSCLGNGSVIGELGASGRLVTDWLIDSVAIDPAQNQRPKLADLATTA